MRTLLTCRYRKAYEDEAEILLVHPDGTVLWSGSAVSGNPALFGVGQTEILAYYGEPVPLQCSAGDLSGFSSGFGLCGQRNLEELAWFPEML